MSQQAPPPGTLPPDGGARTPQPGLSWPRLLALFALLAGMWYQRETLEREELRELLAVEHVKEMK